GRTCRLTEADMTYVRLAMQVWQQRAIDTNDLDILEELVLAEYFATRELNAEVVSRCMARQLKSGQFPGPRRVRDETPRDRFTSFRVNYHTTLVMLVLLTMALVEET